MIEERFELACERIQEIRKEELLKQPFQQYFQEVAKFIIAMEELWIECKEKDYETTTLNALQNSNKNIYSDILPENYQNSYANPEVANARLGDEFGPLLCFLYTEMRSIIPCCFEQDLERFVIRVELFLEVYHAFADSFAEFEKEPSKEEIREIIYWFVNDY